MTIVPVESECNEAADGRLEGRAIHPLRLIGATDRPRTMLTTSPAGDYPVPSAISPARTHDLSLYSEDEIDDRVRDVSSSTQKNDVDYSENIEGHQSWSGDQIRYTRQGESLNEARVILADETEVTHNESGALTVAPSSPGLFLRHVALALGALEAFFSIENAVTQDAFSFNDERSAIFAVSAAMELVGLGTTFLPALFRRTRRKECVDTIGEPLVILACGIRQRKDSLIHIGDYGILWQAIVVFVLAPTFLVKAISRWSITLLIMAFCLVYIASCAMVPWVPCIIGVIFESSRQPDPSIANTSCCKALYFSLPLLIDITEVMLLVAGGLSWNTSLLVILDVVVVVFIALPWKA